MQSLLTGTLPVVFVLGGCGTDAEPTPPSGPVTEFVCADPAESLGLWMSALGPPYAGPYDGPVVVERSTYGDLTLTFGEGDMLRRARIGAARPLPSFPVGARLWLSKVPAVEPPPTGFVEPEIPRAWSLRDREGGTLLMGASWQAPSDPASPITARAGADTCVGDNPWCSSEDASIAWQAVDVFADETVVFEHGEIRRIAIDGKSYLAQAVAMRSTGSVCAADYYPDSMTKLSIEVVGQDPLEWIEGVEVGEPPECAQGNDLPTDVDFAIYDGRRSEYQGPVFFRSKSPELGDTFLFEIQRTASDPEPDLLGIAAPPKAFSEPIAGTEYWAEFYEEISGLHEPGQGPLVVATLAGIDAPFDAPTAERIARVLGVPVRAEPRCQYVARTASEDEPVHLWDLVFDTTPPTRVRSGTAADLVISGRHYEVSLTSVGPLVQATVFRR